MRQLIIGISMTMLCAALSAQETVTVPDPPAIPTPEERARADEAAKQYNAGQEEEQDDEAVVGVDTRETVVGDATVTEYSRAGQVHMLKVKPKHMPPQYIDQNQPGGSLEPQNDDMSQDVNLPKWKIGSW